MAKSEAEEALNAALWADPLPGWDLVREFRFHPGRQWRFDFAFPSVKLAVEVDGRGRHHSVAGFRADCEKLNEATRMGWRVLRFPATDKRLASEWAALVKEVLCAQEEQATEVASQRSGDGGAQATDAPGSA